MKDAAFLEQLQQELPRRSLSPKATRRFEDTYKMLGVQQEGPVKKRRHKGLWVTATAACLCCGMLFGVNAVFPAIAENLPAVGKVFETINGNFTSAVTRKISHGAFLDTYPVQEVHATSVSANGSSKLDVLQAFSDGQMLSFSLEVTLPQETEELFDYVGPAGDTTVTINGTVCRPERDAVLYKQQDGSFKGAYSFSLPETLTDGEKVQAEISIPTLSGHLRDGKSEFETVEGLNFQSAFAVDVDASANRSFTVESQTDNGAQVLAVDSTPTQTRITAAIPDWGKVNNVRKCEPRLYTLEGIEIPFNLSESLELGNFNGFDSMEQTCTFYFDGTPSGTSQVVLRFYDSHQEQEILAEFTIDLTGQTAAPSTTYDDEGSPLSQNSPFHYDSIQWHANPGFLGQKKEYSNGLRLSNLSYSKGGAFSASVCTAEDYREIQVDLYTADGTLLGSSTSQYGTEYSQENWYWDENSPFWDKVWSNPEHLYRIVIHPEINYLPAWGEQLTVVITDASGSELLRQAIQLDTRNID